MPSDPASMPMMRNASTTGTANRSAARLKMTLSASSSPNVVRKSAVASGSVPAMSAHYLRARMHEASETFVVTRRPRFADHEDEPREERHTSDCQQRDACRLRHDERGQ